VKSFEIRKSAKLNVAMVALAAIFMSSGASQILHAQAAPAKAPAQRSPVAPTKEQVQAAVNEAYDKFKSNTDGKNADYIPELAKVDPKLYGIAIITADGQVVTAGDVDKPFSIQSISKVFSLALAMEELGPDKVFEKIGCEPTGRPFNSVEAVVDMPTHSGNPFVNAGAIATVSLISAPTADANYQ
jgi:glutaminase